jgi:hypothetical protein
MLYLLIDKKKSSIFEVKVAMFKSLNEQFRMGNIRKYLVFMMGLGCNLKKMRKISILMGKMDPHMADRILHLLGIACT